MQGGGEEEPDEDAENAGVGGCGLGGNLDVAVCRADWLFHLGLYQVCLFRCWAPPSLHQGGANPHGQRVGLWLCEQDA
jgi:hypothetical protein